MGCVQRQTPAPALARIHPMSGAGHDMPTPRPLRRTRCPVELQAIASLSKLKQCVFACRFHEADSTHFFPIGQIRRLALDPPNRRGSIPRLRRHSTRTRQCIALPHDPLRPHVCLPRGSQPVCHHPSVDSNPVPPLGCVLSRRPTPSPFPAAFSPDTAPPAHMPIRGCAPHSERL